MNAKSKVLVVDDEPSVADALRLILEEAGYEAVAVSTGSDGLVMLNNGAIDLLITDLRLPDMSGLALLGRAAGQTANPPAIVITAFSSPEVTIEAQRLGAIAVLAKPFSPSTVLELVSRALNVKEAKVSADSIRES